MAGSSLGLDGRAVWAQTPSTRMDAGPLRRCGASPWASVPTAPQLCPVGASSPAPLDAPAARRAEHHSLPCVRSRLASRPLGVEHLPCSEPEPSRFQPRMEPISEPPQPRRASARWAPDGDAAFGTVPRASHGRVGSHRGWDGRPTRHCLLCSSRRSPAAGRQPGTHLCWWQTRIILVVCEVSNSVLPPERTVAPDAY